MISSPFDDLTEARRLQIREAHAAAKVRVMAADLTSSTAERGQCRVCDGWYLITARGKVRHHGAKDGSFPPNRCPGAGQFPKSDSAAVSETKE